ncbi:DUF1642 domain-containing protein [Ligilactobacillus animalis]|uniref:DUF1642 domain-containing protein n=1 Tax=Ligilactobacillus animalis TaxID=1605 RepID=UPI0026E055E7|nr:DUF1642 domain-containing protein [Ligilactobacillus animalis]MDO5884185.1 DUF1642 domain-containing protein [Ligilactobacillus animalis]
MTEEKDFWINKDEVGILNGAEGTEYKVTQETMNQKGWYKLADDEQVVKKAELTKEEAECFEKYKDLPFFKNDSTEYFAKKALDYSVTLEGKERCCNLFSQAYFNGYTVKKEPKYYIKFPTWQTYEKGTTYLNVRTDDGAWGLENKNQVVGFQTQFTQKEIYELQKDERAKGLDLNALKVKVPDSELAD